ncbi:serine-rich adhesin for platelets isoform X5 [Brienomyrus brachyistius]|uniref:serine-rich adhesin for platelets isoform X4 n=1 Tax=Brienomyrus brachyistius TaxID=42636 RepID=UPI0020B24F00|nr:serine-rich adhesin for platelets isoform X4 [Brienomyrus brachyistius]XP_048879887.1 serine-rich adhesin for platelets isoform X5 [Brienomyrus brachyistius]
MTSLPNSTIAAIIESTLTNNAMSTSEGSSESPKEPTTSSPQAMSDSTLFSMPNSAITRESLTSHLSLETSSSEITMTNELVSTERSEMTTEGETEEPELSTSETQKITSLPNLTTSANTESALTNNAMSTSVASSESPEEPITSSPKAMSDSTLFSMPNSAITRESLTSHLSLETSSSEITMTNEQVSTERSEMTTEGETEEPELSTSEIQNMTSLPNSTIAAILESTLRNNAMSTSEASSESPEEPTTSSPQAMSDSTLFSMPNSAITRESLTSHLSLETSSYEITMTNEQVSTERSEMTTEGETEEPELSTSEIQNMTSLPNSTIAAILESTLTNNAMSTSEELSESPEEPTTSSPQAMSDSTLFSMPNSVITRESLTSHLSLETSSSEITMTNEQVSTERSEMTTEVETEEPELSTSEIQNMTSLPNSTIAAIIESTLRNNAMSTSEASSERPEEPTTSSPQAMSDSALFSMPNSAITRESLTSHLSLETSSSEITMTNELVSTERSEMTTEGETEEPELSTSETQKITSLPNLTTTANTESALTNNAMSTSEGLSEIPKEPTISFSQASRHSTLSSLPNSAITRESLTSHLTVQTFSPEMTTTNGHVSRETTNNLELSTPSTTESTFTFLKSIQTVSSSDLPSNMTTATDKMNTSMQSTTASEPSVTKVLSSMSQIPPSTSFKNVTSNISSSGVTHSSNAVLSTKMHTTEVHHLTLSSRTTAVRVLTTNQKGLSPTSHSSTISAHFSSTQSITLNCTAEDCRCDGAPCFFNVTSNDCKCQCNSSTFGNSCEFGGNNIPVIIGVTPTRKVNISLRIMKNFDLSFKNLKSSESQKFINIIIHELEFLCKGASPENFMDVKIIDLRNGSIIAETVAQYSYPNNQSQINFLNNDLVSTLKAIFNNTDSFKNLSQALGGFAVNVINIYPQPLVIMSIMDLKPFVSCDVGFANYTPEIVDGGWECVSPCVNSPDYCHQQGECFNAKTGPVCKCFEPQLGQYYGAQCQFYRRTAQFYGVLFGVLASGLFLLLVIGMITGIYWKRKRKTRFWDINKLCVRRWSSVKEEYFRFHQDYT